MTPAERAHVMRLSALVGVVAALNGVVADVDWISRTRSNGRIKRIGSVIS